MRGMDYLVPGEYIQEGCSILRGVLSKKDPKRIEGVGAIAEPSNSGQGKVGERKWAIRPKRRGRERWTNREGQSATGNIWNAGGYDGG